MNSNNLVQSDRSKASEAKTNPKTTRYSPYEVSCNNQFYFMNMCPCEKKLKENKKLPDKMYSQMEVNCPSRGREDHKSYTHKRVLEVQPHSSQERDKTKAELKFNPNQPSLIKRLSRQIGTKSMLHVRAVANEVRYFMASSQVGIEADAILGKRPSEDTLNCGAPEHDESFSYETWLNLEAPHSWEENKVPTRKLWRAKGKVNSGKEQEFEGSTTAPTIANFPTSIPMPGINPGTVETFGSTTELKTTYQGYKRVGLSEVEELLEKLTITPFQTDKFVVPGSGFFPEPFPLAYAEDPHLIASQLRTMDDERVLLSPCRRPFSGAYPDISYFEN